MRKYFLLSVISLTLVASHLVFGRVTVRQGLLFGVLQSNPKVPKGSQAESKKFDPTVLDCVTDSSGRKCTIANWPRSREMRYRELIEETEYNKEQKEYYSVNMKKYKEEADQLESAYKGLNSEMKRIVNGMLVGLAGEYKETADVRVDSIVHNEDKGNIIILVKNVSRDFKSSNIASVKIDIQLR